MDSGKEEKKNHTAATKHLLIFIIFALELNIPLHYTVLMENFAILDYL